MSEGPPADGWGWLRRRMNSTRWSLVRRMHDDPGVSSADEFCRVYWYPLYAFVRSSGHSHAVSQDHVQTFLMEALRTGVFRKADPTRGRFRNFLMTLMSRHVSMQRGREQAMKRGGGVAHVSVDWAAAEASYGQAATLSVQPADSFRLALAQQLVREALAALEVRYRERADLFRELLPTLEGTLADETFEDVATRLGMKPGTVRVEATRLRARFAAEVRRLAARLLGMPQGAGLDAELREIFCGSSLPPSV